MRKKYDVTITGTIEIDSASLDFDETDEELELVMLEAAEEQAEDVANRLDPDIGNVSVEVSE